MNYETIAAALRKERPRESNAQGTYNDAWLDGAGYLYRKLVLALAYNLKDQNKDFDLQKFVVDCGEMSYGGGN